MTTIDAEVNLGTLVTEMPAAAKVLERWGVDYCCGGQRQLAAACNDLGVDVASVVADLEAVEDSAPADWSSMNPAELTEHIVATHHAFLWEELPRLCEIADKVNSVHGANHTELGEVRSLVHAMRADLEPHMSKEESILFPAIRDLNSATGPLSFPFGTISNPISMMMREHDNQGDLMDRLALITDNYSTPSDGCASYQALYSGLKAVDTDTRLHVHKENNLLFPAVEALESKLTSR